MPFFQQRKLLSINWHADLQKKNKLEKMWKYVVMAYFKVLLLQYLPGRTQDELKITKASGLLVCGHPECDGKGGTMTQWYNTPTCH
jgi:hypothetical protein